MRLVTAFLLLSLAPGVLAQPRDPAQTDDACADTTTWQRYFPLDVGNIWQYRQASFDEPITHWSWTITGTSDVGGQTYFALERCDATDDGGATCADPVLLRYDDANDVIVRRDGDVETWWDELPCRLAVEFNGAEETYACTGPGTEGTQFTPASGTYGATVEVLPDQPAGDTRKVFSWFAHRDWEAFAGLGVTKFYYELQGEPTQLVYANVGGEQVGTPAFASCDPADAGDIVCPDTTDWRRYFPLEVGNQWQYDYEGICDTGACRSGLEIVGEEVVDGVRYFLMRYCSERSPGDFRCFDPGRVRYGTSARTVISDELDGTLYDAIGACNLAFPFNFEGEVECGAENPLDGSYWSTSGWYDRVFDLGEGPSAEGSVKIISSIGGGVTYFAGIGPIGSTGDGNEFPTPLVFARVSGVEYGTRAFVFPTSDEPGAAQPMATAFTEAFPNPARGAVQAQYVLGTPQAVTLELIDLLGRRVRSAEIGRQSAGAHDVRIDTGGLRPGLYVLWLRDAAGAEATRRIVVFR